MGTLSLDGKYILSGSLHRRTANNNNFDVFIRAARQGKMSRVGQGELRLNQPVYPCYLHM